MSTKTMPAGQLHLLLWHYFTPDPYPKPSGCFQEFVDRLISEGLMDYDPTRPLLSDDCFELTERGRVYIEAILNVRLPVQRWMMEEAS